MGNYDSFNFVPDAKIGITESTSSAAVFLNIAKLLSNLNDVNNNAKYNIIFYLTSAKSFNYEGLNIWLTKAENLRIVNKIEFALVLENLSTSKDFQVSIHNVDENSRLKVNGITQILQKVAQYHKLTTNSQESTESLLGKKFPILKIRSEDRERNWIGSRTFDRTAIITNTLTLTEIIVRTLYNLTYDYQILDNSSINLQFLNGITELFESKSTFPLKILKDSTLSQEIYRAFGEVVKHSTKVSYSYSSLQLYSSETGKLKMVKINSPFFDFYLLVGNLTWLSLLYLVLSRNDKTTETEKQKISSKK